ncbi:MAG: 1-deoxy-D-xylulose-5-phosphate reductoisomerase [Eubacteriales bacterium]
MMKKIAILGSTGSIGTQTIEVCHKHGMEIVALTAHKNINLLEEQCRAIQPKFAVLTEESDADLLKTRLKDLKITILFGLNGLIEVATLPEVDTVVTALMGMVGLRPTLAAIEAKKRIALANKETLVCAGTLVMESAARHGAEIIPVDSEHSAIFQCLAGNHNHSAIKKIILTCSGGPFFGKTTKELEVVTKADALRHPNWEMGAKITIDSATLMNKGLEFIEAMHLFALPPEQISVIIHRESILHSMVEFQDHSMLGQMGTPDMKLPIQYALTYPERREGSGSALNLLDHPSLTFATPDLQSFPCLDLAIQTAKRGGSAGAILNAANEEAVALFLAEKITFLEIPRLVSHALSTQTITDHPTLDDILMADQMARNAVHEMVQNGIS